MRRLFFLLPLVLVAYLAYPRLHRRFVRYQASRAAGQTAAETTPRLRNGDLIFQTSQSAQSRAIQLATHSAYSHCGILFQKRASGGCSRPCSR